MAWRIAAWISVIVLAVLIFGVTSIVILDGPGRLVETDKPIDYSRIPLPTGLALFVNSWFGNSLVLIGLIVPGAVAMFRKSVGGKLGVLFAFHLILGSMFVALLFGSGIYLTTMGHVFTGHTTIWYTGGPIIEAAIIGLALFLPAVVGGLGSTIGHWRRRKDGEKQGKLGSGRY